MIDRERAARRRARWLLVSLAAGGLVGAACMGSVDRVYVDGGVAGPDGSVPDVSGEGSSGTADGVAGDDAPVGETDAGADVESAPDAPPAPDATPQDGAPDGSTDAPGDAPADGPPPSTFNCNGAMVSSCAACSGKTQECVFCGAGGAHPGVCVTAGQLCSMSTPSGAQVCNCSGGSPATCPAPIQVCTVFGSTGYCQTCGEQYSDTHACKGGGTCHSSTATCN